MHRQHAAARLAVRVRDEHRSFAFAVSQVGKARLRSPGFPIGNPRHFLKKIRIFSRFFLEIPEALSLDSPSLARNGKVIDGSIGYEFPRRQQSEPRFFAESISRRGWLP